MSTTNQQLDRDPSFLDRLPSSQEVRFELAECAKRAAALRRLLRACTAAEAAKTPKHREASHA